MIKIWTLLVVNKIIYELKKKYFIYLDIFGHLCSFIHLICFEKLFAIHVIWLSVLLIWSDLIVIKKWIWFLNLTREIIFDLFWKSIFTLKENLLMNICTWICAIIWLVRSYLCYHVLSWLDSILISNNHLISS